MNCTHADVFCVCKLFIIPASNVQLYIHNEHYRKYNFKIHVRIQATKYYEE